MVSKSIVVTVGDEALGDIQGVAKRLGAKGMKITRVLPMTGIITGSFNGTGRAVLEKVDGVISVEDDAGIQLSPPGSSVQ